MRIARNPLVTLYFYQFGIDLLWSLETFNGLTDQESRQDPDSKD